MILKELDPFASEDRLAKAGRAAEEQVAFYLRRAFADDKEVQVINGLRLTNGEDAAQMDHLVLHPCGGIIVESKSVTGRIRVNVHQEWSRSFNGVAKGMPSPILQAERQGDFLQSFLKRHRDVFPQGTLPLNIFVAISDGGMIDRPRGVALDEVCKADQIPDQVRFCIRARRQAQRIPSLVTFMSLFTPVATPITLSIEELRRLAGLLLQHHAPLTSSAEKAAATRSHPPQAQPVIKSASIPVLGKPVCPHCGSADVSIEYGYSYYYKCLGCSKNMAINPVCAACGAKAKLRKAGNQYHADCGRCGVSSLLFST